MFGKWEWNYNFNEMKDNNKTERLFFLLWFRNLLLYKGIVKWILLLLSLPISLPFSFAVFGSDSSTLVHNSISVSTSWLLKWDIPTTSLKLYGTVEVKVLKSIRFPCLKVLHLEFVRPYCLRICLLKDVSYATFKLLIFQFLPLKSIYNKTNLCCIKIWVENTQCLIITDISMLWLVK